MLSKQVSSPHCRPVAVPWPPLGGNSRILRRLWLNRGGIHRRAEFQDTALAEPVSGSCRDYASRRPAIKPLAGAYPRRIAGDILSFALQRAIRRMFGPSLCIFLLYPHFWPMRSASIFSINSIVWQNQPLVQRHSRPRNFLISGFNCWRALQRDLLARAGGKSLPYISEERTWHRGCGTAVAGHVDSELIASLARANAPDDCALFGRG